MKLREPFTASQPKPTLHYPNDCWLDSQFMSTFEPPPPQYFPAVSGPRPRSKSVNSGPAALFGLISPFRHSLIILRRGDYMAKGKPSSRRWRRKKDVV